MNARRLRAQLWLIAAAFFALCSHAQDRQPEYQLGAGDAIRWVQAEVNELIERRLSPNRW